MTPLQLQYLAAVERDRRSVENQYAPIGRRISRAVRLFAFSALRVGVDAAITVRDKLMELLPDALLGAMFSSYKSGMRRAGLESKRRMPDKVDLITARLIPPSFEVYEQQRRPDANNEALRFAGSVAGRVRDELQGVSQSYGPISRPPLPANVRAVRSALDSAGVSADPAHDHGITGVLETTILKHYSLGITGGYNALDADGPKGYRHISIVDERTTAICREMHGTQLRIDHPFWQDHTAPLHWRCRSILMPIYREFEETDPLPSVDAMPGFGGKF